MILPEGVWMANLAGFIPFVLVEPDEDCEGFV
jgi:hypothetical protein